MPKIDVRHSPPLLQDRDRVTNLHISGRAAIIFDKVDEDGSGAIDREEFASLAEKLGGGEVWSESELKEAFDAVDTGA